MNQDETIWVGSGKRVKDYDLINVSICVSDCEPHFFEYNGKKYLKVTVAGKKNGPDQYGKTHGVKINTYNPDQNKQNVNNLPGSDDTPF